jgi:hypothetical protein
MTRKRRSAPASTAPRITVAPSAVLAFLRAVVGSPLLAPLPGERPVSIGWRLPDAMTIDAGAWASWCLAGLHVCERFAEPTPQPRPPAEHAAANGPGALAIVNALAWILERAEVLRAGGHEPRRAIVQAAKEHGASRALAGVAFAAWMLAVGGGEASP